MKISSFFSASAIAASSLITVSTVTLAFTQPKNIATNLESQSSKVSVQSPQKIAATSDEEDPSSRICTTPYCGWW